MRATRPRARAPRSAFTLIELIVSAAVMAMVLAAAYACLHAGVGGRRTVELRSHAVQQARVAMQRMAADFRSACPMDLDQDFIGQTRSLNGIEADLVDFATHHHTPQRAREGDVCEVSYFVDQHPQTGVFSLWRRRDASPDLEAMGGGVRELIVEGLRGLRFEYYDGLYWHDEWGDPEGKYLGRPAEQVPLNASGMPEAVRITLWMENESAPAKKGNVAGLEETPSAPLMFQTVARLILAPIAAYRSSGGSTSASESGDTAGGEP